MKLETIDFEIIELHDKIQELTSKPITSKDTALSLQANVAQLQAYATLRISCIQCKIRYRK